MNNMINSKKTFLILSIIIFVIITFLQYYSPASATHIDDINQEILRLLVDGQNIEKKWIKVHDSKAIGFGDLVYSIEAGNQEQNTHYFMHFRRIPFTQLYSLTRETSINQSQENFTLVQESHTFFSIVTCTADNSTYLITATRRTNWLGVFLIISCALVGIYKIMISKHCYQ